MGTDTSWSHISNTSCKQQTNTLTKLSTMNKRVTRKLNLQILKVIPFVKLLLY